jgi:uncharacterized delta-60 repeat protein
VALTVAGVVATAVPAYAASGDLDPTFGVGGVVTTDFGVNPPEPEIANEMVIQPDGKIVVAGRAGTDQFPVGGDGAFGIARYLPNGTLDPSFGTGGLVKTSFQGPPNRNIARAVALQSDGKIVVGGTSGVVDTTAELAVARYNTDGSLDPSLGTGGKVLMNVSNGLGDGIRGLAVQPDGKILGVGAAGGENLLIRFNANGSLDSSFGNGGTSQPVLGDSGHLFTMRLLSNGTFLAAGTGSNGATQEDFLVARFTSTGDLDTTFGTGGLVTTAITALNDLVFDMAVTGTGQIILAGEANSGDVLGVTGDTHFALARYNANGSLDTAFGTAGVVDDNLTANQDEARGIVLQANGKIVVAGPRDGSNVHADPTAGSMAVIRYNADGTRDTTFGTGGVATTTAGGSAAGARDIALDSDGRIVVCGGANMPGTGVDFAVARFLP